MKDMPKIMVQAPDPYPSIEVESQNPRYARLLMEDIASYNGEMTAIYQYQYQNWILSHQNQLIASTMQRIARVEMHHLDMLGRLIILLGGDPGCMTIPGNRRSAWVGNYVNYDKNLRNLLTHNVVAEQAACRIYKAQIEMIEDKKVSAILSRIVRDEELHVSIFQDFLMYLS